SRVRNLRLRRYQPCQGNGRGRRNQRAVLLAARDGRELWIRRDAGDDDLSARPVAGGLDLGGFRHRPARLPDAGASVAARGTRPHWSGRQLLPGEGRQSTAQRRVGRKSGVDHAFARPRTCDVSRGARYPRYYATEHLAVWCVIKGDQGAGMVLRIILTIGLAALAASSLAQQSGVPIGLPDTR